MTDDKIFDVVSILRVLFVEICMELLVEDGCDLGGVTCTGG